LDVRGIGGSSGATIAGAFAIAATVACLGLPAVGTGPVQQRRALAGAGVVAAFCAPMLMVRGGWGPPADNPIPAGLAEATAVVIGLLVALAFALALAARDAPLRYGSTIVAGSGLAAAALAYAATFGGTWLIATLL